MQIENSVFVVTGGASGLGAATVRMVVEQGGKAVAVDMNAEAGAALVQELGAPAAFVAADITGEAGAMRAIETATARYGGLHALVNCAGIAPAEKVVGRDAPHALASFARVVEINLIGTFNMIRLAADAMRKAPPNADGERGVIISTASVAAFEGQVGQAAYAASKGGVVAMTLPIARELARHGIRVLAIAPGIMETPMMAGMPAELRETLDKSVPFPPRMGRPAEFAALVRHMVENPYLNGEVVRLDGAIRMAAR